MLPATGPQRVPRILNVVSLDDEAARLLAATTSWSLHARFERSLILASADGALVTLLRHDLSDGPYAARLSPDAPRDLRSLMSVPGLDWTSAKRWRVEPILPAEAVDQDELLRRLRLLDEIAARADAAPGTAVGSTAPGTRNPAATRPALSRGIDAVADQDRLRQLETAIASGDTRLAAAAATELAGLGPGLTPSGDDLLCGALACHAWAESAGCGGRDADGRIGSGRALRSAIASAAIPRTSRLAGQALDAASRGHVSAPLAALLVSLFRRNATVPPDIAPLLAIGETSGHDLLAGVRLAGRALGARLRDDGCAGRAGLR